jgi:hypothetical protein
MFHPNVDDAQKALFNRTGAWPTATSIITASDNKLMVIGVHKILKTTYVAFGLDSMFGVCTLLIPDNTGKSGDEYKLFEINGPSSDPFNINSAKALVESKSARYLSSIVSNKDKSVNEKLLGAVETAENWPHTLLRHSMSGFYEAHRRKDFDFHTTLSGRTTKWLLDHYNNEAEIPPVETAEEIARVNNAHRRIAEFEKNYARDVQTMFSKDKWFVVVRNFSRVVMGPSSLTVTVGVASGAGLADLLIKRVENQSIFWEINNLVHIEPMGTFFGYDNIDPSYKDALLGRLTMAKQLRERLYPGTANQMDPSGFTVSMTSAELRPINTIYSTNGGSSMILMDKD